MSELTPPVTESTISRPDGMSLVVIDAEAGHQQRRQALLDFLSTQREGE